MTESPAELTTDATSLGETAESARKPSPVCAVGNTTNTSPNRSDRSSRCGETSGPTLTYLVELLAQTHGLPMSARLGNINYGVPWQTTSSLSRAAWRHRHVRGNGEQRLHRCFHAPPARAFRGITWRLLGAPCGNRTSVETSALARCGW